MNKNATDHNCFHLKWKENHCKTLHFDHIFHPNNENEFSFAFANKEKEKQFKNNNKKKYFWNLR